MIQTTPIWVPTPLPDPSACARCGLVESELTVDDLCPGCLLAMGTGDGKTRRVGDYLLVQQFGEGGMGQVYLGVHVDTGEQYAVKLAKSELLEVPEGFAAFKQEIKAMKRLSDPHIARIEDFDMHQGRPYLVMKLLLGGTLEDAHNREDYREPTKAGELMLKIARTVQSAQEAAILHCDVHPANILFDESKKPYVSDFGLARILDERGFAERPCLSGGRPGWAAPEQMAGGQPKMATDVFGLGVMLHWLLHDALPFSGTQLGYTGEDALPRWEPTRAWALRAICQRALQRDHQERYATAREFADDLERAMHGLPVHYERSYRARRLVRWVRQHKLATCIAVQLLLLLLYVALMPNAVANELRMMVQDQNRFSAVAQAGAVQHELLALALRMDAIARDPQTARLLEPPHDLEITTPERDAAPFDDIFLFTLDRDVQVRWPKRALRTPKHKAFDHRDYYGCALRMAEDVAAGRAVSAENGPAVCVSRVFQSGTDSEWKIGFAAPVFNAQRQLVGIVVGNTKTSGRFGRMRLSCGPSGECFTALLAPLDRRSPSEPLPLGLSVIAAPGLGVGEKRELDRADLTRICSHFGCPETRDHQFERRAPVDALPLPRFKDPLSGKIAIAAVAPAGASGLLVLVASPHTGVDARIRHLGETLWKWISIPVPVGLLLWAALLIGHLPDPRAVLRRLLRRRRTRAREP